MKSTRLLKLFILLFAVVLVTSLSACSSDSKDSADGTTTIKVGDSDDAKVKSLNQLLEKNENVKCTFSQVDPTTNLKSSGTVHTAGKRMRGDFTTQNADGTESKTNVLNDEVYQYMWTNETDGYKMKVVDPAKVTTTTVKDSPGTTSATPSTTTPFDTAIPDDTKYDYDCKKWSVDESILKPPTNVKFVDLDEQLKQAQQQLSGLGGNLAAACASIEDATARAQCEAALRP